MANPSAGVPMHCTPFTEDVTKRDCSNTAQTFYPGEAVALDTSGNVEKCDDDDDITFDGFVADSNRVTVDSGDAAGDKKLNVQRPRYFTALCNDSLVAGDEGMPLWWKFSNEVSVFPGDSRNFAGWMHKYIDSTHVEVEMGGPEGPELVQVSIPYSSPADQLVFTAERRYRVIDIRGRVLAAAAFTGEIKKVANNTTIANGTALHASTWDFNGTNNVNQTLTISNNSSVLSIAAGECLALDVNATATNATGVITVLLVPRRK